MPERPATERILDVPLPNAANRNGSPGRGDLIVPQREIPRPINGSTGAIAHGFPVDAEVGEVALLHARVEARRRRARRILGR